jgi:ABC-type uncharacterized transport system auxiliary subunit
MRRSLTILILALAVLLSACGAARPNKYYMLQLPPSRPAPSGALPVSLLVGRIAAPHVFRDDRLVYRTGSIEMGTYEYHRWAEPPTEMLEAMLIRLLRDSGRYQSVQSQRSNARGDYILRGRLFDLEEISGPPLVARVALEIELYDVKNGTTVWTQYYSHDEPVQAKEVSAVVEALTRNVQAGLQQITAGLDQYFASHPPR